MLLFCVLLLFVSFFLLCLCIVIVKSHVPSCVELLLLMILRIWVVLYNSPFYFFYFFLNAPMHSYFSDPSRHHSCLFGCMLLDFCRFSSVLLVCTLLRMLFLYLVLVVVSDVLILLFCYLVFQCFFLSNVALFIFVFFF